MNPKTVQCGKFYIRRVKGNKDIVYIHATDQTRGGWTGQTYRGGRVRVRSATELRPLYCPGHPDGYLQEHNRVVIATLQMLARDGDLRNGPGKFNICSHDHTARFHAFEMIQDDVDSVGSVESTKAAAIKELRILGFWT